MSVSVSTQTSKANQYCWKTFCSYASTSGAVLRFSLRPDTVWNLFTHETGYFPESLHCSGDEEDEDDEEAVSEDHSSASLGTSLDRAERLHTAWKV